MAVIHGDRNLSKRIVFKIKWFVAEKKDHLM